MNKRLQIHFDKSGGLIPAIIQDGKGTVLMLGYMNKTAFDKTMKTKNVYFWSRSRNELWMKGETSGNTLSVQSILLDCDQDTLLVTATQNGSGTCHTGECTCFNQKII